MTVKKNKPNKHHSLEGWRVVFWPVTPRLALVILVARACLTQQPDPRCPSRSPSRLAANIGLNSSTGNKRAALQGKKST